MKFEIGDLVIHISQSKQVIPSLLSEHNAKRVVIGRGMMETISGTEETYILSGIDSSNRTIREFLHASELIKVD
jgi:hypothetical protein